MGGGQSVSELLHEVDDTTEWSGTDGEPAGDLWDWKTDSSIGAAGHESLLVTVELEGIAKIMIGVPREFSVAQLRSRLECDFGQVFNYWSNDDLPFLEMHETMDELDRQLKTIHTRGKVLHFTAIFCKELHHDYDYDDGELMDAMTYMEVMGDVDIPARPEGQHRRMCIVLENLITQQTQALSRH